MRKGAMADPFTTAHGGGPQDPLLGRVLNDKYRIRSLIARGGMARVYLAEQTSSGRPCALKIVSVGGSAHDNQEVHRRFLLEANLTSKLTHPNTVRVFDYGAAEDDVYFMAMEYLEGRTLQQAIRDGGPFSEARSGHIARQICGALGQAHGIGVVHRDLKPANVFLIQQGDDPDFVKVIDFGLVKDLTDTSGEELTRTGVSMGSPRYIAPEQINAEPVDARTDVYALGVILYEMLTGKVPFDGPTNVSILMAHVKQAPRPVREINPAASLRMERIAARCLAKAPADRFASSQDLLAALGAQGAAPPLPLAPSRENPSPVKRLPQPAGQRDAASSIPLKAPLPRAAAGGQPPRAPRPIPQWARATIATTRTLETRGRWSWAAVLVAAGMGLVVAGAIAYLSSDRSPTVAVAHPAPSAAGPSSLIDTRPTTATTIPDARAAPPVPVTAGSDGWRVVNAPAEPTPTASAARMPAARVRSPSTPPAKARSACNPSYYFDAAGAKHFKPECFGGVAP